MDIYNPNYYRDRVEEFSQGQYSFNSILEFKDPNYFINIGDVYKKDSEWIEKFFKFKDFLDEFKRLPTEVTSAELCQWYKKQLRDYKNNRGTIVGHYGISIAWKRIVNSKEYYPIFNEKIIKKEKKEREQFLEEKRKWVDNMEKISEFVKEYGRLPQRGNEKPFETQRLRFYNLQHRHLEKKCSLMKHHEIREEFHNYLKSWESTIKRFRRRI